MKCPVTTNLRLHELPVLQEPLPPWIWRRNAQFSEQQLEQPAEKPQPHQLAPPGPTPRSFGPSVSRDPMSAKRYCSFFRSETFYDPIQYWLAKMSCRQLTTCSSLHHGGFPFAAILSSSETSRLTFERDSLGTSLGFLNCKIRRGSYRQSFRIPRRSCSANSSDCLNHDAEDCNQDQPVPQK